jgi:Sec-independent protein translocase protein TatA
MKKGDLEFSKLIQLIIVIAVVVLLLFGIKYINTIKEAFLKALG